ncbi:hypothetical protein RJT34_30448 [Clitoria ternatea]|uniref:Uncharacterized protein n=1 Tax=Clitoria ternatea TaxID=43366 RepID=A0AAN9I1Z7_CLITE
MENKKLVLLVVCLALCVGTCMADDMVDEAKEKAGEAKEGAESFASWAYNKVASGFGATEDDKPPTEELPQNVKYQVQDTASDAAEKVKAAGSGRQNSLIAFLCGSFSCSRLLRFCGFNREDWGVDDLGL